MMESRYRHDLLSAILPLPTTVSEAGMTFGLLSGSLLLMETLAVYVPTLSPFELMVTLTVDAPVGITVPVLEESESHPKTLML